MSSPVPTSAIAPAPGVSGSPPSTSAARPPDELDLSTETRVFWREIGRSLVKESIGAIDEVAKQLIAVAGILEGLYFHAIAFSDLRDAAKYPPAALASQVFWYVLPILFLLGSLLSAAATFFPQRLPLNLLSSRGAEADYKRILDRKYRRVWLSIFFLVFGICATAYAANLFLTTR